MNMDTLLTICACSFSVISNIVSAIVFFMNSMHKKDLKALERRVEKIEEVGLNSKWRDDQTRISVEIFAALKEIREKMATKDDLKVLDSRLYDHITEEK